MYTLKNLKIYLNILERVATLITQTYPHEIIQNLYIRNHQVVKIIRL